MATWTKLTADWLVSLTAVAGSSAIVYCEVSHLQTMEEEIAIAEYKNICIALVDAVGPV